MVMMSGLVAATALMAAVGLQRSAAAEEEAAPENEGPRTAAGALPRVLPSTIGADVGRAAVVGSAWGGWDGAARAPVTSVMVEARVAPRLVLMAGGGYAVANALGQGGGALRPELGARFQVLSQLRGSGVDLGVAVLFREDRFGAEDGLYQGVVAVGRRFGATSALVNLAYAQDGEGDDHEGEVRVAVLNDVGPRLHVGFDGRARHSLDSTDPRRATLGTPSAEAFAGPVGAFTLGPVAFMAEAGMNELWTVGARARGGVVGMGGFAAVF
jgi:hypothetical protein